MRCLDSMGAVLDHQAARGVDARSLGGEKEQVWERLAALHMVAGRDDVVGKELDETGRRDAKVDTLG